MQQGVITRAAHAKHTLPHVHGCRGGCPRASHPRVLGRRQALTAASSTCMGSRCRPARLGAAGKGLHFHLRSDTLPRSDSGTLPSLPFNRHRDPAPSSPCSPAHPATLKPHGHTDPDPLPPPRLPAHPNGTGTSRPAPPRYHGNPRTSNPQAPHVTAIALTPSQPPKPPRPPPGPSELPPPVTAARPSSQGRRLRRAGPRSTDRPRRAGPSRAHPFLRSTSRILP